MDMETLANEIMMKALAHLAIAEQLQYSARLLRHDDEKDLAKQPKRGRPKKSAA
jgi:hypothetical protein